jgi:hypothetical protein
MPTLRKTPDPWIPWQWHADQPWRDSITGQMTSYLAGFTNETAAKNYGRMKGWE